MQVSEEIIVYQSSDLNSKLKVRFESDSLWLSLNQLTQLFERDKSVISRHLTNIYKEGELTREATVAKNATVQIEGNREVFREVEYFNLDAVISVGYRVNSKRGTQFRIWATKVLKEKLLESAKRSDQTNQLTQVIRFIARITEGKSIEKEEALGLLQVITEYDYALELLDQYDHQKLTLTPVPVEKESKIITVAEVRQLVREMKEKFRVSHLFGREKDESLESSVAAVFQTFDGKQLYCSPEQKAANLLYFLTKNHSFVDGNKRIAAATFIYFLHKNNMLYTSQRMKIIDNNTLVALTLMLAESNPDDREMLVKVIVKILQGN